MVEAKQLPGKSVRGEDVHISEFKTANFGQQSRQCGPVAVECFMYRLYHLPYTQVLIHPLPSTDPPLPAPLVGQAAEIRLVATVSLITGAGIHNPELMSQQTVELGKLISPLQ